jgi:hypothetical protein
MAERDTLSEPKLPEPVARKLRRDLSQTDLERFGASNIGTLFRKYYSDSNEIWEDYIAINFYLGRVHALLKDDVVDAIELPFVNQPTNAQTLSKNTIYGIINRITNRTNGLHAFIDSVILFEHLVQTLVFEVYTTFPDKLKGLSKDFGDERDDRRGKLLEIILRSVDRDEMIQKLVEEKVRSLFYGNPAALFEKDKANIGFGKLFQEKRNELVVKFQEIVARRNIIVHNQARVDRKYNAEVSGSKFKLGASVSISEEYLRSTIAVLQELAALSAAQVTFAVYKTPVRKGSRMHKAVSKRTKAAAPVGSP